MQKYLCPICGLFSDPGHECTQASPAPLPLDAGYAAGLKAGREEIRAEVAYLQDVAERTLKNLKHGLELSLKNCPGSIDEAANRIHLKRIDETLALFNKARAAQAELARLGKVGEVDV